MFPFFPSHEEEVAVDDGVEAVAEEVGEVVEVLDADTLQEVNIPNEDCWLSSLVDDSEPEIHQHTLTTPLKIFHWFGLSLNKNKFKNSRFS